MERVTDILDVASAAGLVVAGSVVLTYWLLAVVALLPDCEPDRVPKSTFTSFAILIPAHDEETGLGATLESCQLLRYPKDRLSLHVVADNCTDRTEDVAIRYGAECHVRRDSSKRGKGYALAFGLARIEGGPHEAVLILDADCVLNPDALSCFNQVLSEGAAVLQGNYVASNPDASPTSYVSAVGNTLENMMFYRPLSRLGATVPLRGTGMVFRRDVLERIPWNAFSETEDTEYFCTLARHRVPVRFVEGAEVLSAFPTDLVQLKAQRTRWASGNFRIAHDRAPRLIWDGLRLRSRVSVEAGLTLSLLSRPVALMAVVTPTIVAAASAWLRPTKLAHMLLSSGLILLAALVAYTLLGVLRLGLSRRRLQLLAQGPVVLLQMVALTLKGVRGTPAGNWVRTPR